MLVCCWLPERLTAAVCGGAVAVAGPESPIKSATVRVQYFYCVT